MRLLGDEDAALPVALAEHHRRTDGLVRTDGTCRRRHDVSSTTGLTHRCVERREHCRTGYLELFSSDRRGGLGVTPSAERSGKRSSVDSLAPAAHDREDAPVHLHEENENARVREIDDLVREVRDAFDVLGPPHGCDEQLLATCVDGLDGLHQRLQQLSLRWSERRMQVLPDEILACAVSHAPSERVHVPLGGRRVRQGASVLVYPEREGGRLEDGGLDLALRQDADERRGERAV